MDTISYCVAMEEISKVDNSCSVAMSVNNSLVCWGLETYGTEEQKAKAWLAQMPERKSAKLWHDANTLHLRLSGIGEADRDTLSDEDKAAREMGVTGVPCFIIDNKYAVMGAQPADQIVGAIKQAAQMKQVGAPGTSD